MAKFAFKCLIATVLTVFLVFILLGGRAFLLIGDSMEPLYTSYDIVLTLPADSYRVGDIITFNGWTVGPITHKVITAGDGYYRTQGINNVNIDLNAVYPKDIIGRVVAHAQTGRYLEERQ